MMRACAHRSSPAVGGSSPATSGFPATATTTRPRRVGAPVASLNPRATDAEPLLPLVLEPAGYP